MILTLLEQQPQGRKDFGISIDRGLGVEAGVLIIGIILQDRFTTQKSGEAVIISLRRKCKVLIMRMILGI